MTNILTSRQVKNDIKCIKNTQAALIVKRDGTLLDLTSECIKMFQLSKNELLAFKESPITFFNVHDLNNREISLENNPISRIISQKTSFQEKYILKNSKVKMHICCTGMPLTNNSEVGLSGILLIQDLSVEESPPITSFEKSEQKSIEMYQQKLKNEKQLLQSIIDTIPVMITIYEKNANNIVLNKAFAEITGWTNEDTKHRNIMELVYPDPEYRYEIGQYMATLQSGFKDIIMRTKDGRDIETSWANVEISDGRSVGVGIDISERKKLEQELVKARKKAERQNYIQYAFIQNISHEVRTPMNSILGFSELLYNSVKGKKEKEFLDAINFNGHQLIRLIDDIIDFSRLDKNELSLHMKDVSLYYLMNQIDIQLAGLKSSYRKEQLKTTVKIPPKSRDIILFTDIHRLQQVLINLISNAIKYTREGSVKISYKLMEKNNELLFCVKDTGIGISKKNHERVFQRFYRFHGSYNNEYKGTGLGLTICKQLVSLLGGKIWFESEVKKGTTFYFTHPYKKKRLKPATESLKVEKKNYKLPDLKGKTILIVEDDPFSYSMMFYMMNETKAHIKHAKTGHEALEMLQKSEIDIVFLDLRLPEMSGYEVINKLRQRNNKIPVIAQTASAFKEDREHIEKAGFDYLITKPISQQVLFSILNLFCSK